MIVHSNVDGFFKTDVVDVPGISEVDPFTDIMWEDDFSSVLGTVVICDSF